MSNLPFLDLKAIQQPHADALRSAFERVLDSGWYILGEEVRHFEEEYAAYCGARECVGVANGLDALVLALRALDIGPGDEVLVPANTYIATWLATHWGLPWVGYYLTALAMPHQPPKPVSASSSGKAIGSPLRSRLAHAPSSPCTCTASPPIWSRSWRLPRRTV